MTKYLDIRDLTSYVSTVCLAATKSKDEDKELLAKTEYPENSPAKVLYIVLEHGQVITTTRILSSAVKTYNLLTSS